MLCDAVLCMVWSVGGEACERQSDVLSGVELVEEDGR
eukprot:COSAG02_NODE_8497_length_2549_cov_2.334286_3_plen_37_part_00